MTPNGAGPVRIALRSALTEAMKRRDRAAMSAYRTALAVIDNAEAVPLGEQHRAGAIELSAVGVGRADEARRSLSEQDQTEIFRREVEDRRTTADHLAGTHPDAARTLHREAALLQAILDGLPPSD